MDQAKEHIRNTIEYYRSLSTVEVSLLLYDIYFYITISILLYYAFYSLFLELRHVNSKFFKQ